MRELVAARGWRLVTDEPRGHLREWHGDAGLHVGWMEFHNHGVRALWVEADDEPTRDAAIESLTAELPSWSAEVLRRDAFADDLRTRLIAARAWTLAATSEPSLIAGLPEALLELARHDNPVARLAVLDLAYVARQILPDATLALARERAEQDREHTEQWQHLVSLFEDDDDR